MGHDRQVLTNPAMRKTQSGDPDGVSVFQNYWSMRKAPSLVTEGF